MSSNLNQTERLKQFKVPPVLSVAFEYTLENLIKTDNKVICKGCGNEMSFNIDTRTSNLVTHIRDTNHIKHASVYD
jgi:hypothetical protein